MEQEIKVISSIVDCLIKNKAFVATKYISSSLIVRATRKLSKKRIAKGNIEIVLTIGKPNYQERDLIKGFKKDKEEFPIKGIIIKFPPKKK